MSTQTERHTVTSEVSRCLGHCGCDLTPFPKGLEQLVGHLHSPPQYQRHPGVISEREKGFLPGGHLMCRARKDRGEDVGLQF